MPLYETTVRTPQGDQKKQVYADTPQEARKLFEQLYGGPEMCLTFHTSNPVKETQ